MTIGIIPNTIKENIAAVVSTFVGKLEKFNVRYIIHNELIKFSSEFCDKLHHAEYGDYLFLAEHSDFIISIGGDGTMLNTAFEMRKSKLPHLGLNLGKLGFLAEFELSGIDGLIRDLVENNYTIEERLTLFARCSAAPGEELFAVNDIVIDKGRWPKMIELTIKADEDYVTTFSADGLIIASPTGSTGYSLSAGGPIVNPKANVLALSPISPHSLTMRPLILSADQKITVRVMSQYKSVQINCDGQRVYYFNPPVDISIERSVFPMRLVHTKATDYFQILRKKLLWGLDVRKVLNNNQG